MNRRLKPNQKVALFAALVAIFAGLIPIFLRRPDFTGPSVAGIPVQFVEGFLLGLIGVLLVAGVAYGLKTRFFGGPDD